MALPGAIQRMVSNADEENGAKTLGKRKMVLGNIPVLLAYQAGDPEPPFVHCASFIFAPNGVPHA